MNCALMMGRGCGACANTTSSEENASRHELILKGAGGAGYLKNHFPQPVLVLLFHSVGISTPMRKKKTKKTRGESFLSIPAPSAPAQRTRYSAAFAVGWSSIKQPQQIAPRLRRPPPGVETGGEQGFAASILSPLVPTPAGVAGRPGAIRGCSAQASVGGVE